MHRIARIAALVLLAASPTIATAQGATSSPGVIELGIDAGISTTLGAQYNVVTVSIPTSSVRVGFYANDRVSFEPTFGLTSINASGDHYTTYDAAIGVLLHARGERVGTGLYLRPFAGLTGVSTGGSSNQTQTRLGVGLGTTLPIAERIGTRLEVSYAHGFASTYAEGGNLLTATVGLSFFNH